MKANDNPENKLHFILWIFLFGNLLNSFALFAAYLSTHVSPSRFVYFSFFGLTYPIWLVISLIFILFWIFFRPKLVLVSILTLLLGFNHFRHFFTFNISQEKLTNEIKVMSYNVHIFNLYDLENRIAKRNEMFQFLKTEDAGVYCFQEFFHQDIENDFVTKDSLIDLLNTPYYHERYTHEMSDKRYFGVATFSKYPIINKGEIAFDNDKNNFCIYSDVVHGQDTIRVFNAHIGSIRFQDDDYRFFNENSPDDMYRDEEAGQRILKRLKIGFEKRSAQAEEVAAEIAKSPYPVILCGDLNDTPVSYCYRQFSNLLEDAFVTSGNGIGTTYIGELPSNRIDYIFYSDRFESSQFKTHGITCSDHKPISCLVGRAE